jgi:hypothetical protein
MTMLESGSVSSCTSSVSSGDIGPSSPSTATVRGSWSPRLVLLLPQSTRSHYLGATTTTRDRQHQCSLRTFHYDGLRRVASATCAMVST